MIDAVKEADIIVTASGCRDLITAEHFKAYLLCRVLVCFVS